MSKKRFMLAAVGAALLSAAQPGYGAEVFSTGFEATETPMYAVGDLDGQNDWMKTPANAETIVQTMTVNSGTQAVQIIDHASFGRAQHPANTDLDLPLLHSSYAMNVPTNWNEVPEEEPNGDDEDTEQRLEAQQRLEFTGTSGATFGIEFGLLHVPEGKTYETLTGQTSAFYIEIAEEDTLTDAVYNEVAFSSVAGGWHDYLLRLNNETMQASLVVDGQQEAQLNLPEEFASLSILQLQNQRWDTSPQNNRSVFFDDVNVRTAIPTPGAFALMATVAPFALCGRRRRRAGASPKPLV